MTNLKDYGIRTHALPRWPTTDRQGRAVVAVAITVATDPESYGSLAFTSDEIVLLRTTAEIVLQ